MTKLSALFILPITVVMLAGCQHTVNKSSMDAEKRQAYLNGFQKTDLQINAENVSRLDHESVALGIGCSAHKYKMELADDFASVLDHMDKDGQVNSGPTYDVKVSIKWARTSFKCVIDSVASGRCQSSMLVSGEVFRGANVGRPFEIERSVTKDVLSCGGVTEAIEEVSSDVVSEVANLISGR